MRFTDKISDKSIFLPAAGFRILLCKYDSDHVENYPVEGLYWSNKRDESRYGYAYTLEFNVGTNGSAKLLNLSGSDKFSVRCVAN